MNLFYAYMSLLLLILGCGSSKNDHSEPTIFAKGIISTNNYHESINIIDKTRGLIYFTRADKNYDNSTLYQVQFQGESFGKPSILNFSGVHYDAGLAITHDDRMIFTSKRPSRIDTISDSWNLWMVDHDNGEPEMLQYPVNTNAAECCLILNGSGQAYFSSERTGSWDIFSAQFENGQFNHVRREDQLSSVYDEWPSFVHQRGDFILFSSIRKSGYGGDDIYLSNRIDGIWSEAILLDSLINSAYYEDSAIINAGSLYFSSSRSADTSRGLSNVYEIRMPVYRLLSLVE